MKDYIKDLKQCIKRLFHAESLLNLFLRSAGQERDFFKSLDLDGTTPDYKYPIADYTPEKRDCFHRIIGYPMKLPKDFSYYSPKEVGQAIIKRRNDLRNIAGMIDNSRWLGEKNYLCYTPFKTRYWTGRLVG